MTRCKCALMTGNLQGRTPVKVVPCALGTLLEDVSLAWPLECRLRQESRPAAGGRMCVLLSGSCSILGWQRPNADLPIALPLATSVQGGSLPGLSSACTSAGMVSKSCPSLSASAAEAKAHARSLSHQHAIYLIAD